MVSLLSDKQQNEQLEAQYNTVVDWITSNCNKFNDVIVEYIRSQPFFDCWIPKKLREVWNENPLKNSKTSVDYYGGEKRVENYESIINIDSYNDLKIKITPYKFTIDFYDECDKQHTLVNIPSYFFILISQKLQS